MSKTNIGTLRSTGGFMRTVAGVVLVTFTTVTVSPSVQAMQQYAAQQQVQRQAEAEERDNIGKNLARAKERLRLLADMPAAGASRKATAEQRRVAREELRAWRAEYRDLKSKAKSEFDATGELLERRQLPQMIKERHAQAVAKFQSESAALETEIEAAVDATSDETARVRAEAAFKRLDRTNLERSQQEFDPNNLPNSALKADPGRKPKLSVEAFQSAGLFSNPSVRYAQASGFDISQLPGASNPAYLGATTEIVITPDVQARADELGRSPIAIYNWVRNNVHWQPTWGAIQDASHTLSSQRGNAFDLASLTIALLRASGIPARYVHGAIDVPEAQFRNWAGGFQNIDAAMDFASAGGVPITAIVSAGQVTRVRLEHIWVETAIDFVPSRGVRNRVADSWVAMDPSYKQIEVLPGLDAVQISGINPEQLAQSFLASGTVNEAEGWATGFNPVILQNAQAQARTALENHITQNLPNATVGDVLGGRRIIVENFPILPTGLPNRVVVAGARYATLPASLQQQITFAFGKDVTGDPINPRTFPWAQLNNRQVTLSFRSATQADEDALRALLPEGEITDISQLPTSIPAYLIRVVPELKVEGNVVMSGSSMTLGTELNFVFNPRFVSSGTKLFSYKVLAGSYLAVAVFAGSVSPKAIDGLRSRLEITQLQIRNGNAAALGSSRERLIGDLFASGLLSYYGQYSVMGYLSGLRNGAHHQLAAGLGSFGYEPKIDYFFGVPRRINPGSAVMNIPIVNVATSDSRDLTASREFTRSLGAISSVLEHEVPQQMLASPSNPGRAVSAVKVLSIASAAGQPIYRITNENQAAVLPLIRLDTGTMQEIRAALAAGKSVMAHPIPVTVPGWTGAGYVLMDDVTGAAAWKISGGSNGGSYSDDSQLLGSMMASLLSTLEEAWNWISDTAMSVVLDFLLELAKKVLLNTLSLVVGIFVNILALWESCSGLHLFAGVLLVLALSVGTFLVLSLLTFWWAVVLGLLVGYALSEAVGANARLCEQRED